MGRPSNARKTVRLTEMEGIIASSTIEETADGREYTRVVLETGEYMALPLSVEDGGNYDFPVDCSADAIGQRIAVRAVFVPTVDSKGERREDTKHYLFATPEKGDISLANVPTLEQYLASAYQGKPGAKPKRRAI